MPLRCYRGSKIEVPSLVAAVGRAGTIRVIGPNGATHQTGSIPVISSASSHVHFRRPDAVYDLLVSRCEAIAATRFSVTSCVVGSSRLLDWWVARMAQSFFNLGVVGAELPYWQFDFFSKISNCLGVGLAIKASQAP
jgi:hypothetical protein